MIALSVGGLTVGEGDGTVMGVVHHFCSGTIHKLNCAVLVALWYTV